MTKLLPAALMLCCALSAGAQSVAAPADDALLREEIAAGLTDPAVIEGSALAFGFSESKAGAYADFMEKLASNPLFLDRVVSEFSKIGIDSTKLRALQEHGTSDEYAALSEEILQGSLLLTQRLMSEGVPYSSARIMKAEMRTTRALCERLPAKACRDLNLSGAQALSYDDLDAAAKSLARNMTEKDMRKMFEFKLECIENALEGRKPEMTPENVREARAAYSSALNAALRKENADVRERFRRTVANMSAASDEAVCEAFRIIYGAILETTKDDPEGNVLRAFYTGKLL